MNTYTCRTATATDKDNIRSLYRQTFNDTEQFVNRLFNQVYPNACVAVVECDGTVVAAGMLLTYQANLQKENIKCGYIYALMTHEEHRRQGCMRMVLAQLEDEARRRNMGFLFLVNATNKLKQIYTKFGFASVGELAKETIEIGTNNEASVEITPADFNYAFGMLYEKNDSHLMLSREQLLFEFDTLQEEHGCNILAASCGRTAWILGKPDDHKVFHLLAYFGDHRVVSAAAIALAKDNNCTQVSLLRKPKYYYRVGYGMAKPLSTDINTKALKRLNISLVMDI